MSRVSFFKYCAFSTWMGKGVTALSPALSSCWLCWRPQAKPAQLILAQSISGSLRLPLLQNGA